jgi:tellurite resistance protein TerA
MGIDYTKRQRSSGGAPAPASGAAPASSSPVSLTKRGEAISLTKDSSGQPFRFNLNWNPRPAGPSGGGGFMSKLRGPQNIDLDLGCLWELTTGEKGVVQALGNQFGNLDGPPFIKLDKDDRSGTVTEGENLFISSTNQSRIKRMVVYAFIYEGVANWSQADAVATIHQPGGAPITIRLDEHRDGVGMCAIARLESAGSEMELAREVVYFAKGHPELDQHYGWGMRWQAGRK